MCIYFEKKPDPETAVARALGISYLESFFSCARPIEHFLYTISKMIFTAATITVKIMTMTYDRPLCCSIWEKCCFFFVLFRYGSKKREMKPLFLQKCQDLVEVEIRQKEAEILDRKSRNYTARWAILNKTTTKTLTLKSMIFWG